MEERSKMPEDIFDKQRRHSRRATSSTKLLRQQKKQPPSFVGSAREMRAAPKPFTKEWFKGKLIGGEEALTEALAGAGATVGARSGCGRLFRWACWNSRRSSERRWNWRMEARQQSNFSNAYSALKLPPRARSCKRHRKEGTIQAGVQLASEGMPLLAGPLKSAAVSQYERALAPTTKINKAITKDIVPGLLERGEHGSLQSLEKRAAERAGEIRPELRQEYLSLERASPTLPVRSTATGRMQKTTVGQIPGAGKQVIQDLESLKGK